MGSSQCCPVQQSEGSSLSSTIEPAKSKAQRSASRHQKQFQSSVSLRSTNSQQSRKTDLSTEFLQDLDSYRAKVPSYALLFLQSLSQDAQHLQKDQQTSGEHQEEDIEQFSVVEDDKLRLSVAPVASAIQHLLADLQLACQEAQSLAGESQVVVSAAAEFAFPDLNQLGLRYSFYQGLGFIEYGKYCRVPPDKPQLHSLLKDEASEYNQNLGVQKTMRSRQGSMSSVHSSQTYGSINRVQAEGDFDQVLVGLGAQCELRICQLKQIDKQNHLQWQEQESESENMLDSPDMRQINLAISQSDERGSSMHSTSQEMHAQPVRDRTSVLLKADLHKLIIGHFDNEGHLDTDSFCTIYDQIECFTLIGRPFKKMLAYTRKSRRESRSANQKCFFSRQTDALGNKHSFIVVHHLKDRGEVRA